MSDRTGMVNKKIFEITFCTIVRQKYVRYLLIKHASPGERDRNERINILIVN